MNNNQNEHSKIFNCEIKFKIKDITSLRWLTEVKSVLKPFHNKLNIVYYPSSANYIILNNDIVELYKLEKYILNNLSNKMLNTYT